MEGTPAPAFPSAFMKTIVSLTGAGKPIAILSWERNVMGKLFQTFTPCGPVITTKDEISDPPQSAARASTQRQGYAINPNR
ncbi:MAG: hypothetical protein OSB67_01470 [Alphaproteobacteria bacterium]|nr:hypothetical protein [Alphaproteobacteria bacterium]